jgi:hypothetical protein
MHVALVAPPVVLTAVVVGFWLLMALLQVGAV